MRTLTLKLPPGSDIRLSLERLSREEGSNGFVLGVVGNLSRAAFQCPGRSEPTVLEGNLEIITLNGTVSPDGVHLHLSLSDGDCQVWGGHLEPGSLVLKGADLLVGLLDSTEPSPQNKTSSINQSPPRVEIAVLPGCPWSARALRILNSLEVPYLADAIDNDSAFEALKQRTKLSTFPQIFVDGHLIGGFEALSEMQRTGKLECLR